jgi:hypothetical protein
LKIASKSATKSFEGARRLADLPPEEALRQLIAQTYEVILTPPEFIGCSTARA